MERKIFTFAMIAAFGGCVAINSTSADADLPPGYNPDAISVNSIVPDRGLADPHILIVNDTLYAMCGHDRDWDIVTNCQMDRWEMWSTANLKDWEYVLSIDSNETYIGDEDNCWAGDLATKDGKYYWYFSNRFHSTGVMSAPSIKGPWTDALGEPLLPTGIIGKGKPYDPEIYEEDGRYYIIFSAGQYWIAELGDDMISLKSEPEKLMVYKEDGVTRHPTGDKPCIFKRNGWFYLMWGEYYAMSRTLNGPYIYKGDFIHGGHGTVFEWKNQWYTLQEQHETNAFYRGVQLRPLYFNDDDTVFIPEHNWEYPLPGRDYDFTHSRMGWRCEGGGTDVEWVGNDADILKGYITGEVTKQGAIVTSVPFIHTPVYLCENIYITLDNLSGAKELQFAMYSYEEYKGYVQKSPKTVDWESQEWVSVPLKRGVQEVVIPLSKFATMSNYAHQFAIRPMADRSSGEWKIDRVLVK